MRGRKFLSVCVLAKVASHLVLLGLRSSWDTRLGILKPRLLVTLSPLYDVLSFLLITVVVQSLSCVQLFAAPWTVACQSPLSTGFPRQESGVGCHFLLHGNPPNPGTEPQKLGFDHWVGTIPWRRAWQSTPVFLPGESPWTEEPGGLFSP